MKLTLAFGSRAFWLRQMRQWHWISAAICLIGMLLFAVTGITLNHAGKIESKPVIHSASNTLQAELLAQLNSVGPAKKQALPQDVADWIGNQMSLYVAAREAEWSAREIYVALPRPGGDAWLTIDLATARSATKTPIAAGSPTSTTCTRAATPALPGLVSSTCSPSPASCFASPGWSLLQLAVQRAAVHLAARRPGACYPRALLAIFFIH